MIYYNIIDNKKVFFESDIIFASYEATLANEAEREEYFLEKAKNKKQKELDNYYSNNECWTYTLFSNLTKTYASLTRDANFFAKLLPCCGGKTIQFLDDQNKVVNYSLTIEKADNLNYKINVNNGTAIRVKKLELENKIAIATNIEIIDSIDIKTELLNSVERNIDLDKFN